jgi:hypothetical protein
MDSTRLRYLIILLAGSALIVVGLIAPIGGLALPGLSPALPAPARQSLLDSLGPGVSPRAVRTEEVRRIGPYLAVVYLLGDRPGAAVISYREDRWETAVAPDPDALRRKGTELLAATALPAAGLEVVFVAVFDRRVARVTLNYPGDQTRLDQARHGPYMIFYRVAPTSSTPFFLEAYDRGGRRLGS